MRWKNCYGRSKKNQSQNPDAGVDRLVPVSYTHLRAHETVLDLVCRLLLEKKKNNLQSAAVPHRVKQKNRDMFNIHTTARIHQN